MALRPRYMAPPASRGVRVLLVGTGARPIPPTGYGGIERTIADLSTALASLGVETSVLNEVHPGRLAEYRFASRLRAHLAELSSSVVHAHTPVVAARLRKLSVPYVYTTHSRHWFIVSGPTQRWGLRLERRAVSTARAAIALTDTVRSRIESSYPAARRPTNLTTVGLGVDLERFRPTTDSGDPKVALGVGALIPSKRWDVAARSLEGTGIRLRLIGPAHDPGYAERLRGFEGVELVGEVPDAELVSELRAAGFLLHPSAAELFPAVVAQAMAVGRPVVGFRPIADLVRDGENGLIVSTTPGGDSESVHGLREAAVRLSHDDALRTSLGRAGRSRALQEFDWRSVAEAHRAIYLRAAGLATPGSYHDRPERRPA